MGNCTVQQRLYTAHALNILHHIVSITLIPLRQAKKHSFQTFPFPAMLFFLRLKQSASARSIVSPSFSIGCTPRPPFLYPALFAPLPAGFAQYWQVDPTISDESLSPPLCSRERRAMETRTREDLSPPFLLIFVTHQRIVTMWQCIFFLSFF